MGAFLLGFRYTVVLFTLLVLVLAYLEGEIMEQRNTKCFLARDNMIICTRVAIAGSYTSASESILQQLGKYVLGLSAGITGRNIIIISMGAQGVTGIRVV